MPRSFPPPPARRNRALIAWRLGVIAGALLGWLLLVGVVLLLHLDLADIFGF